MDMPRILAYSLPTGIGTNSNGLNSFLTGVLKRVNPERSIYGTRKELGSWPCILQVPVTDLTSNPAETLWYFTLYHGHTGLRTKPLAASGDKGKPKLVSSTFWPQEKVSMKL